MSEAVEYAEAISAASHAEHNAMACKLMAKRIFSQIVLEYNDGSIIERQHKARAHPRYIESEDKYIAAASEANLLGAIADAAKIKWETWRSEHATARVLR